jgi:putative hemolysin
VAVYLILLVVLIFLSAFFSSAETAFLSLQRVRLQHQVQEGVPGAARVASLLERPQSLLSAILLGNNLVNTAAAAVGTAVATELITGGGGVVAATIVMTVLLVLFGEVTPKAAALSRPSAMSRAYAVPLGIWWRLTRPIGWALDHLAAVLQRAIGGSEVHDDAVLTTAELRTAIQLGAEAGAIEMMQSSRLLGALTLDRRQVQEIMISRIDMTACEADDSAGVVAELLASSRFQRLPVYEDRPDEVVGYVHVSDLNAAQLQGLGQRRARDLMRPVTFESEHASIARVLEVMQEHATYLVMLVDEFGVTSGLVTLEDIMEEVVGELRSESGAAPPRDDTTRREDGATVVDGSHLLVDLSNELGVDFTGIEGNTVAGLVLAYLRHFPERGEFAEHAGYRFTVLEADARRITRVAVEHIVMVEAATE